MSGQDGSGGGPLDDLFGDFRRPVEAVPYHPVHTRVLTVGDPEGATMALAVWEDPGGAPALHRALRARIEAALLAALSQPANARNEASWRWLRVVAFAEVPDMERAVRAFGLAPAPRRSGAHRRVLAHLRHEQSALDRELPEDPRSLWEVGFALPEGEAGERLAAWDRALAEAAGEEVWGEQPGGPFRRLAALIERDTGETLAPDRRGLARLERVVVQRATGPIRWIPPLVFQALCDAVAVVAQLDFGREVQWALSEPDEHGLAPPPLVRVTRPDGGHDHLPLGLALLRWCVMPLQPGEEPAPLDAWLADQLGS